ncbi:MAG: macro domain-containing protein [Ancrocorticia sp.]|jgi:O-acetyl-ADP-ribose deacetylase (regulator of RNase III)|nr:macro domain-containing protein [Ancrocorticia sp.]MCI1896237.1 macro domain-containing protein [Ancrocorticia sp.]MCI1932578.1 macro domain-containing protein [Ancrocorticia sp.]MCI1963670.1 macro domain-containing protein [Ancrocorticia sp.]MCI2002741.1 macro domain-containing protein [Ancrocorticia sp.]
MLPLSAYRDAIHLDEPFVGPESDPRPSLELIDVALNGLERKANVQVRPDRAIFTPQGLMETLREELMAREPGPLPKEVSDAISVLLYRQSAELGRTTGANLMRASEMWPGSDYGSARDIAVWRGDVRELVADAIVNAALPDLLGCHDPYHPCIDNYIQGQAGPWLRNDCAVIHEMQGSDECVGGAKLTRGYRLPARYVLHTVSPHLEGGIVTDADRAALASCYTSCLDLALEKGDIHNVSFCALSTGENGFPFEEATHIALKTVDTWLNEHGTDVINLVIFNIYEDDDAERYAQALLNWIDD